MTTTTKSWHFANWSPLGWLETVIKLVALGAALIALANALSGGVYDAPVGGRLVQVIVLAIIALGLTAAIIDRYRHREITAMIFVLINVVGHWGMVYALLTAPGPGSLLLIFAGLMLLGDVVKMGWLRVSGYTQDGYPQSVMYGLVGVFVAGYLIILLLALAGG
ncbi:MAG: hypothetical protein R3E39_21085 [Anaerolineae bacterium]